MGKQREEDQKSAASGGVASTVVSGEELAMMDGSMGELSQQIRTEKGMTSREREQKA